jgi:hypothetical protein
MRWETHYRPHIEQPETRVLRLGKGDLARLSDLENPQVVERLKVPESSWNNAKNEWAVTGEEESFKEKGLQAFSPDVICASYGNQSVSESPGDKSAFTFLLPNDGSSLFVCSIVPMCEGDFLGIFAGKIRFSGDFSSTHGPRSYRPSVARLLTSHWYSKPNTSLRTWWTCKRPPPVGSNP